MHKAKVIYFNIQTLICILYMYSRWHFPGICSTICFRCILACPKIAQTIPKKKMYAINQNLFCHRDNQPCTEAHGGKVIQNQALV